MKKVFDVKRRGILIWQQSIYEVGIFNTCTTERWFELTMHVFDFSPMKESRSTCVSLLALNGKCPPLRPKARIHSLSAKRDLLISAPSIPAREEDLKHSFTCLEKAKGLAYVSVCLLTTCLPPSHFPPNQWVRIFHGGFSWRLSFSGWSGTLRATGTSGRWPTSDQTSEECFRS